MALIEKGALPVDETWDGIVPQPEVKDAANNTAEKEERKENTGNEQISLFD